MKKDIENRKKSLITLYLVIPCYNEENVLPITYGIFLNKLNQLISSKIVNKKSRVLFVNDGSNDNTMGIIKDLSFNNEYIEGISLSRNRGHQNALLAGMLEAKDLCDAVITLDCDGQHDINAIDEMLVQYKEGFDIVYGVRNNRTGDSTFKRFSSELYYKLINALGGEIIVNHADYRLVSSKVLKEFENFKEVNIFLRGMFPLVGFKSTIIHYNQLDRQAGHSHYSLSKMLTLAIDGITSLSIKPIRIITGFGFLVTLTSFIGIIYIIVAYFMKKAVQGLVSMTCVICFISGIQLISLGVIGEYIGKIYMETKQRPRYIISEKTYNCISSHNDY